MPYVILMTDKPDTAKLRADTRAVHLDYLEANQNRLLAAGALIEDDGSGGSGSLYIVDTEDRAEAERFLHGDPFHQVGLFGEVTITRWRKAFFNGRRLV
jgi:uncharacterized protein YciI